MKTKMEGPTQPLHTQPITVRSPMLSIATGAVLVLWAVTLTIVALLQRDPDTLIPVALSLAVTATITLVAWGCAAMIRRASEAGRRTTHLQIAELFTAIASNRALLEQVSAKMDAKEWAMYADLAEHLDTRLNGGGAGGSPNAGRVVPMPRSGHRR